ncbi:MAG: ribonuclease R [Synoicihabitans sp.]
MKFISRLNEHLNNPGYRPVNEAALVKQLKLNKKDRRVFSHEVRLLLSRGELVHVGGDKITLPRASAQANDGYLSGVLRFRTGGSALVIVDQEDHPDAPDVVQIASEDAGTAFHGDRVRLKLDSRPNQRRNPRNPRANEPRGRIVEIIERGSDTVVGTLRKVRRKFYVAPDDPRFVHDISVSDPADGKLQPPPKEGDKVVARVHEWTNPSRAPEGRVIERLGFQWEPRAELLGIYRKFDLSAQFPPEVMTELKSIPDEVETAELKHRLDYRKVPTFTIDPDDAKDFDDALSVEELKNGQIKIGVHIADVSSYVKPGTALDKEAQRRGNSTYLVGTVIPMLPEKISNGLCSLVEGQDRLTKAVFLTFNKKRRIVDTAFANTVIRSRKRLTYKQAYTLLKEDDIQAARDLPLPPKHQTGSTGKALSSLSDKELGNLQSWVRTLWSLANRLRRDRMAHGSLDLEMSETKIYVDEKGYAERLELVENDESHQLIEEFMLAANEAVAKLTRQKKLPALYRVHDDPDEDKLAELQQYYGTFGIRTGDLTEREQIKALLITLRDHPQGHVLRTQLLRSLKKAAYRSSPDGHYGLHKRDYAHFTSPIRRYADLVVHRVLQHHLIISGELPKPRDYRFNYDAAKVDRMGRHLSITETNSQEAERESQKIKLLEFFERDLKKRKPSVFAAIVTDVRSHGLFIELEESQTFGFLAANALGPDFFNPNNDKSALIGRKSKEKISVGDRLHVSVSKVDRIARQIDFQRVAETGKALGSTRDMSDKPSKRPPSKSKRRGKRY